MAGNVETMMCLMFVMRIGDDLPDNLKNDVLFQIINEVLQTSVQKSNYRNCSAMYEFHLNNHRIRIL